MDPKQNLLGVSHIRVQVTHTDDLANYTSPKGSLHHLSPILWTKIEIELTASVRDRDRASKLDLDLDLCPKDRAPVSFIWIAVGITSSLARAHGQM
jgi:hypothetical protein